jgi:hypothetical protein
MKYGSTEYQYAAPIARALIDDASFRRWVLSKSEFAEFLDARVLHDEMSGWRRNATAEWWRFHFTAKCRCLGCSGKETTYLQFSKAQPAFASRCISRLSSRKTNSKMMAFNPEVMR